MDYRDAEQREIDAQNEEFNKWYEEQDFDWGTGWEEPDETYCEHLLYRQTEIDPAEYCESIAIEGTDRCGKHTYDHEGDY